MPDLGFTARATGKTTAMLQQALLHTVKDNPEPVILVGRTRKYAHELLQRLIGMARETRLPIGSVKQGRATINGVQFKAGAWEDFKDPDDPRNRARRGAAMFVDPDDLF